MANAATAAIEFALEDDDGIDFLRYWNEGEFDILRREWPEAPEAVFIGADQFHPETAAYLAAHQEYPVELTPALRHVLGMMNFQTGPLAALFREAGHDIPRKCEAEQAFVLHRMIRLVLQHDTTWEKAFGEDLQGVVDTVTAQRAGAPA